MKANNDGSTGKLYFPAIKVEVTPYVTADHVRPHLAPASVLMCPAITGIPFTTGSRNMTKSTRR